MLNRLESRLSTVIDQTVFAPLRQRLPVSGPIGVLVEFLTNRAGRPAIRTLPLTFAVDRSDDQHVVWVYHNLGDEPEQIKNVYPLLNYGHTREEETEEGSVIYVIAEEDRQTLMAMKSLNPQIREDGALLFEFSPPILKYMRHKRNLAESKESRRLTVTERPLRPKAKVNFEPDVGVSIEAGYEADDFEHLLPKDGLNATMDGDFVLVGDTFHPKPEEPDVVLRPWLEGIKQSRSLNDTPHFFQKELPEMKAVMEVELTDQARKVRVAEQPLRPGMVVDFRVDEGLVIETGYQMPDSNNVEEKEQIKATPNGAYAIVGDDFIPFPDRLNPEAQAWLECSQHKLPLKDVPSFLRRELPYLKKTFDVQVLPEARRIRVEKRSLKPTAQIDFDPESGCHILAGYTLPGDEQLHPRSHLPQTSDGRYAVFDYQFVPIQSISSIAGEQLLNKGYLNVPLDGVPEFFVRDLALIRKEFDAVFTDLASEVNIIDQTFQPVVKADHKSRGWLDFDVAYEAGGIVISHDLALGAHKGEYIQLDETTWLKPDKRALVETERQIARLGATKGPNGYRVSTAQFASLEEFIEKLGGKAQLTAAYHTFLDQLTGFQANENYRLGRATEENLKTQGIQLRPYQRAGIHWLSWLYDNYLHGVLADDMGLGKTLQSIMTLRRAYEESHSRKPSLVICPRSVMTHWERELHRFFPAIKTVRYHGPAHARRSLLGSFVPTVFVSTYATVRNDIEHLVKISFFYLVLDEATAIKNPSTKQTKAVKALNAEHRLALSGTPVENQPGELWSLFDFLMRGHLGTQAQFEQRFELPISNAYHNAADELARRIRPFMLRRKKEDVAKDLPEKIELDEWCELTKEQRQLYGSLQDQTKRLWTALRRGDQVDYPHILSVLQKLKQICDHPALVVESQEPILGRSEKFDWIIDKVSEILSKKEQVAIFSHYLDMLGLLQSVLESRGIPYIRIDGSTRQRQSLVDRFNAGRASVALLSLRAAGHGITLTGANHVIHADRWWNPAIEDQATDRVHRIGQDKTVYVYRILVSNTLEERIDELLTEKRGIADRIIGAASNGDRRWTREELIEILRPFE